MSERQPIPITTTKTKGKRYVISEGKDKEGHSIIREVTISEFSPNGTLAKINGKWRVWSEIRVVDVFFNTEFADKFAAEIECDPNTKGISAECMRKLMYYFYIESKEELINVVLSGAVSRCLSWGRIKISILKNKLGLSNRPVKSTSSTTKIKSTVLVGRGNGLPG